MSGKPATPVVAEVARADGWLVTSYEVNDDLVLDGAEGERVVSLVAGDAAVVPKGVWHRFTVVSPAVGVAMTFGRGTQHRPLRTKPQRSS